MKCPICGNDVHIEAMKRWKFGNYDVSRFQCPQCGKTFNTYQEGGDLKYTIPKAKK
jgi:transposase-like protein